MGEAAQTEAPPLVGIVTPADAVAVAVTAEAAGEADAAAFAWHVQTPCFCIRRLPRKHGMQVFFAAEVAMPSAFVFALVGKL